MVLKNVYQFLDEIFLELETIKIDVTQLQLDHICYRVESCDRYEQLRDSLSKNNHLLIESEVNSRLISTFKLTHPIFYKGRFIDCLEVPSPKNGSAYQEGFEHVEFVINESFKDFMQKYDYLNFSIKGMDKLFNPEIKIDLKKGYAVKFHHLPLEKVIEIEVAALSEK